MNWQCARKRMRIKKEKVKSMVEKYVKMLFTLSKKPIWKWEIKKENLKVSRLKIMWKSKIFLDIFEVSCVCVQSLTDANGIQYCRMPKSC